jgi:hypothetical protein
MDRKAGFAKAQVVDVLTGVPYFSNPVIKRKGSRYFKASQAGPGEAKGFESIGHNCSSLS